MHRQPHIPAPLLRHLRQALPTMPGAVAPACASSLPPAPGAYLLLITLREELPLSGRLAGHALPAGHYLYAGSARGPGGLSARLTRHLKQRKKIRWHVDQLTTRAASVLALPFPDASDEAAQPRWTECRLATLLADSGHFTHPLPGFGSSDCPACLSHLLRWREA